MPPSAAATTSVLPAAAVLPPSTAATTAVLPAAAVLPSAATVLPATAVLLLVRAGKPVNNGDIC